MRIWMSALLMAALVACSGPTESKNNTMVVVITDNSDPNNSTMTCPECGAGEACIDGFCQIEGCEPTCSGTACGPNGCGGMCNPCQGREQCVDGACELGPMDCSGFSDSPSPWALPSFVVDDEMDRFADTFSCANGELSYQILDIDGDGRFDLVVTDSCDQAGVGTTRWDVYQNTGAGFADTPSSWALPTEFADEQFDRIAATSSACGTLTGEISHQILDLTGDRKPDLVLTDRCDQAGVGTTRWDVYENTGSGFASTPTSWAIPTEFAEEQFDRIAGVSSDCGTLSGEISHQVLDLTGDGRPDFVLTDRCDAAGVGTTRWDVYENTGSGFASSPTSWSIPTLFVDEQLDRLAATTSDCGAQSGEISHQVLDLTGDGRPDLVLTDRCDAGGVGTARWDVHENTGLGFAQSPTPFTLPTLFQDEQFERIAATTTDCGAQSGEISHQLVDMDADGLPDLLLTDRCDAGGVGTARWEYHRNRGNGFESSPTQWTLPTLFVDEQFERIASITSDCGTLSGEVSHSIMDLDGDGAIDLVLSDRCDEAGVGTDRWDLHSASCP